jgi:DNA polymerase-1
VTIHCCPSDFDTAQFATFAAAQQGELTGLDVETTAIEKRGQYEDGFGVRLVQLASTETSWVIDPTDPEQHDSIVKFLADPEHRFVSHTDYDPVSVYLVFGELIVDRWIDTHTLARLREPDAHTAKLKRLVSELLDSDLGDAEFELHERFRELWKAEGGRLNVGGIDGWGWSHIASDDPAYLRYAAQDALDVVRLVPELLAQVGMPPELIAFETWLTQQATLMSIRGYRVDPQALDVQLARIEPLHAAARQEIQDITGFVAGSPKLGPWLEEQGVVIEKRTHTGKPSLAKDNLELLLAEGTGSDEAKRVMRAKVQAAEVQNLRTNLRDIAARRDATGRVHPTIHTLGARTGRMSVSGPAMQTFSKADPTLRSLFLPEDGETLIACDFAQIELRVVAAFARERKMIEVIESGGDLHQLTADEVGITRQIAKKTNFLIVYGGGAPALSAQTGIPRKEAEAAIAGFKRAYPAIERLGRRVGHDDEVRNIAHRRIPGDGRNYANINYLVQSSARELLTHAWYRFAVQYGHADRVWMPIHDELVVAAPWDRVPEVCRDLEAAMSMTFFGVPVEAEAIPLIDRDGVSRWMTGDHAKEVAQQQQQQQTADSTEQGGAIPTRRRLPDV